MNQETRAIYKFGSFTLDTREGLLRDGEAISLASKAYEILLLLVQNSQHVLEKEYFLEKIWPDIFVDESNLTQNIFRLRKILGDSKMGNRYIKTVPKRGYRFVADVQVVTAESTELPARPSAQKLQATGKQATAFSIQSPPSIAIFPFDVVGRNADAERLSDGITQGVINSLSQLGQLRVMAWSSVSGHKGQGLNVFRIGREMGVQFALTGSLLLFGNKLVVRVELVNMENGWQLWGECFRREFSDNMALQEDIAWEVSEKLRLKFTSQQRQQLSVRDPEHTEAYQLYLKGRFFWNKRNAESLKKAMTYIQKAIELNPGFALAHAGLADCYCLLSDFNLLPRREAFLKAKASSMKALELDDTLAEVHASLALISMLYDWDWLAAERGLKRAIALNPNYAPAHHRYAKYASRMGRFSEALTEMQRALSLEPLSLVFLVTTGQIFYLARDYDRAIEQCREALELSLDFGWAYGIISMAYAQKGMYEEAVDYCQKYFDRSDDDLEAAAFLACFNAALGHQEKALDKLGELHELARRQYVSPGYMSIIHLGLGNNDEALKYMEDAYRDRATLLTYLKVLPLFDPIRPDTRFKTLLHRMNFVS